MWGNLLYYSHTSNILSIEERRWVAKPMGFAQTTNPIAQKLRAIGET